MSEKYLEHLKEELNELKKKCYACSLPKDLSLYSSYKVQIQDLEKYLNQNKDDNK